MKKIYFFIPIFLCLFASMEGTQINSQEESILAFLFIRHDRINNEITQEIYPVCINSNGKFDDLSISGDWEYENSINDDFVKTKSKGSILDESQDYVVFKNGIRIGDFQIDRITLGIYGCLFTVVGKGKSSLSQGDIEIFPTDNPTEERGSYNYGKVEYNFLMKHFVALNKKSKAVTTQERSRPVANVFTSIQKKKIFQMILDENNSHLKLIQPSLKVQLSDIHVTTSVSYDLDGDGVIEHLIISEAKLGEYKKARLLQWMSIKGNEISPIKNLFHFEQDEDSMDTKEYVLVDLLDIDGDKVPEVIFRRKEYEIYLFEIYKFDGSQFKCIFSGAGYGC